MPDVTLFLPEPPRPDEAAAPGTSFGALDRLTARAVATSRDCRESAQWSCEAFGVDKQQDWPVAPLGLHAQNADPGDGYWLCATPVHMQVRRDQMLMMPPGMLSMADDEAAELLAALASHFSPDGLEFRAPNPQDWYMRCANRPDLQTTSVELAAGRHVDPLLPTGKDRMKFHRLINEAQMLLHEHPVNVRREARGVPAINSVWLSGGGTLPAAARSPWPRVASGRWLERGLAKLAGVPEGLAALPPQAQGLHVLEAGLPLEAIDRDWVRPLLAQLSAGALESLGLVTVTGGRARQWRVQRSDLWKFWRRTRSLETLLREPAQ